MSCPLSGARPASMQLTINGETRDISLTGTAPVVLTLLEALGLLQRRVAVEINAKVIRRALHGAHTLKEGDVIEIVHFVGGG